MCELLLACASRRRREIATLGEKFAGPLGRFFPLVLSPWFIFGSPVTLADIRAACRRQLPPGVSLKDVGETLVKLYDGGGKTIGLLHSLGYTRGLLNDIGCGERTRLAALVSAARLGLEEERYRAGVEEARGDVLQVSRPVMATAILLPRTVRLGMWWARLQVWFTGGLLFALWPIARFLEPRRVNKRVADSSSSESATDEKGKKQKLGTEGS